MAIEHALEVDMGDHAISTLGSLSDIWTHSCSAKHATTVGDQLAINFLSTSVEDLAIAWDLGGIDLDLITLAWALWITFSCEHYSNSWTGIV